MKIPITVPEEIKDVEIRSIRLILGTKSAIVDVWKDSGSRDRIEVDLHPMIGEATTIQINTIKTFLKKIVATALDIDFSGVPNTIFKNSE